MAAVSRGTAGFGGCAGAEPWGSGVSAKGPGRHRGVQGRAEPITWHSRGCHGGATGPFRGTGGGAMEQSRGRAERVSGRRRGRAGGPTGVPLGGSGGVPGARRGADGGAIRRLRGVPGARRGVEGSAEGLGECRWAAQEHVKCISAKRKKRCKEREIERQIHRAWHPLIQAPF